MKGRGRGQIESVTGYHVEYRPVRPFLPLFLPFPFPGGKDGREEGTEGSSRSTRSTRCRLPKPEGRLEVNSKLRQARIH